MRTLSFRLALGVAAAVLSTGLSGCEKISDTPVQNLRGGRISIIGHAGNGFESALNPFPPNTLSSIRKTLEGFNADGVELDVHLSADSVPILYHDQALESTTGCVGYPLDYSAAELTSCAYRTDFNSHITQSERILTLEEVLARYAGSALRPVFSFDLKTPNQLPNAAQAAFRHRFARRLVALVNRYQLTDRVGFESGDVDLLLAVRKALPAARLYLDEGRFDQAFAAAKANNLKGLVGARNDYSKEQVAQAHAANLEVIIFQVVIRSQIMEAIEKNPDAIQTDNILLTQQLLAAKYGK